MVNIQDHYMCCKAVHLYTDQTFELLLISTCPFNFGPEFVSIVVHEIMLALWKQVKLFPLNLCRRLPV